MNKTSKIISGIVILLIVGAGAFYFGMDYGKSQATTAATAARAGFASRTAEQAPPAQVLLPVPFFLTTVAP